VILHSQCKYAAAKTGGEDDFNGAIVLVGEHVKVRSEGYAW